MSAVKYFLRIHKLILKHLDISLSELKNRIDSFPNPKDDFERTYFAYRCHCGNCNMLGETVLDIAGFIAIPFFIALYSVNRIFVRKRHIDAVIINANNRAGECYSYDGRVPEELYDEFKNVEEIHLDKFPKFSEGVISFKALRCWNRFFIRHPLSGYINFRALLNIMGTNHIIKMYSPKAIIIGRAEARETSSLLTELCESNKCEYINIMHGELILGVISPFVRFSRFYIWDEHYKKICNWSRADSSQYRVFLPEIYKIKYDEQKDYPFYLTYILTGNENDKIDRNAVTLREILIKLENSGKKCKVRPHPRWSDMEYLKQVFDGTDILVENPRKVTVKESLKNSKYVVGTFSTVMSEAYYGGKKVLIDDITDAELIRKLEDEMYVLVEKAGRFSEIVCK